MGSPVFFKKKIEFKKIHVVKSVLYFLADLFNADTVHSKKLKKRLAVSAGRNKVNLQIQQAFLWEFVSTGKNNIKSVVKHLLNFVESMRVFFST